MNTATAKDFTADLKEKAEKAGELAKNIWLAGLGAYGKAVDETQGQYEKTSEKVNQESSRLFDELVAKGKEIEGETQTKCAEFKEKSSASLEERLAQVKANLSFGTKNTELAAKVDELSEKLDLIIDSLKKPAAKKAAAAEEK
jgi:polyhydroxyalkanoate synthesis regulator phasin